MRLAVEVRPLSSSSSPQERPLSLHACWEGEMCVYKAMQQYRQSGFKSPRNAASELVLNLFSSHNWSFTICKDVGYLLVMTGNGNTILRI